MQRSHASAAMQGLLSVVLAATVVVAGCGGETGQTASTDASASSAAPAAQQDTRWFNRGGDMSLQSTLADWRAADEEGRLESAADFLKMKASDLSDYDQAIARARTLEAEITAAAEAGEDGALGAVVERVFGEQGWPIE